MATHQSVTLRFSQDSLSETAWPDPGAVSKDQLPDASDV